MSFPTPCFRASSHMSQRKRKKKMLKNNSKNFKSKKDNFKFQLNITSYLPQ